MRRMCFHYHSCRHNLSRQSKAGCNTVSVMRAVLNYNRNSRRTFCRNARFAKSRRTTAITARRSTTLICGKNNKSNTDYGCVYCTVFCCDKNLRHSRLGCAFGRNNQRGVRSSNYTCRILLIFLIFRRFVYPLSNYGDYELSKNQLYIFFYSQNSERCSLFLHHKTVFAHFSRYTKCVQHIVGSHIKNEYGKLRNECSADTRLRSIDIGYTK